MLGKCQQLARAVCLAAALEFGLAGTASADVFHMPSGQTSLQMVPIGNAGNSNDPATNYGGVDYNFGISQFEVTIGQYAEFLNAVAATDTYGVYSTSMETDSNIAGIARGGVSGSYTYTVIGSPNRPIAYVSWGDAARFANWITNGQPTGEQTVGTTESGSYALNGATTDLELNLVTRNIRGRYFIPTENEWYKAAYYDPTKGGSHYWPYPMMTGGRLYSDQPPGAASPNPAFAGNIYQNDGVANGYDDGYAVLSHGSALTDVGAYSSASSYYRTFDQGGNLWEWNEALIPGAAYRGVRGGSWESFLGDGLYGVRSTDRREINPLDEGNIFGFRVSEVPEPASASVILLGAVLVAAGRQRNVANQSNAVQCPSIAI